jgi:DNA-binding MarR family transcriptional regulator
MNDIESRKLDDLHLVMAAGRQIHAAMDRLDRLMSERLNVNRTDLRCLFHLMDKGAATPGDICNATGLTSGSVTTLIDRLERQGLAERRHDCLDRRSVTIDIPEDQRSRVETETAALEAAILDRFAALEAGQLALVAAALPLFVKVLEDGADQLGSTDRNQL